MNDPGQSYTETQVMNTDRNVYVALFMDFLPLLGLAFTILMLKGLKAVKASYMGETFMARFANIIITSSIGALLAVGCAAVLPLVYPSGANEASMAGIVVFMAVGGVRVVDGLVFKYMGIHLVDSSLVSPAESEWLALSESERQEALELWRERRNGES